ncbi:MAG: DUF4004 family protein [Ruminococcaceae bacterium]|nr:DUF4004 family protein [Oscillospiraceae bacterium]MBQ2915882.1 DUF4004 family protein [Clostridia bacterium]
MEQKLISKKDLLKKYEISYGALYRWKRIGLIPEDWFIKKATVTGQETFFPEDLICERIELIINQKDDLSLEEISQKFNSETEKQKSLVIDTLYGKKVIFLNEIRSVSLDSGNGEIKDITELIIERK